MLHTQKTPSEEAWVWDVGSCDRRVSLVGSSREKSQRLPWSPVLPMQGALVQFLVRKLNLVCPQLKISHATTKIEDLSAATKTRCSQIIKYFFKKRKETCVYFTCCLEALLK